MSDGFMVPELKLTLADESATARLAAAVARVCVAGELIRLVGDLGAGKSTFARYFLQALGHAGEVPSPTYTLVQTYEGTRFPVAHVDCYRMKNPEELDGLGLEEYRAFGILLVEWPDKGSALVAEGQADFLDYHINSVENPGTLTVEMRLATDKVGREVVLRGSPSWQRRWAFLARLGVREIDENVVARRVDEAGRRRFLDGLGLKGYQLQPFGGDWSGRSYARVVLADGTTRILMDAPPPQEGVREYAAMVEYYRGIGLRAAETFGVDEAQGYLLSEDFGDVQLFNLMERNDAKVDAWFLAVAEGLVKQCRSEVPGWARRYSARDFWVEAARFVNWYLPFARGRATTVGEYAEFQALWLALFERANGGPKGLMMWDCQSPNLMILEDEPKLAHVGWIDIQDGRVAPVAQDLGHLLRNIRTGRNDAREALVLEFVAKELQVDVVELKVQMEILCLHNACRLLGGLVRIWARDGKAAAPLAYLGRTWEMTKQSYHVPELKALVDFMAPWEAAGMERLMREAGHGQKS